MLDDGQFKLDAQIMKFILTNIPRDPKSRLLEFVCYDHECYET